jgi:3-oxoacyl-[acyl-carrier-protein] synthase-3
MVIHYYSTLNEKLCSTTPARLQHEADLRGAFGFSVGQKNGNAGLIAMKIAAETLIAEPHLKSVLLAGSDKLVPPYERVFGKLTITGDSASAMVIRRGAARRRFLAFNSVDFPEWWNPYQYSEEQMRVLERFLADNCRRLLDETLRGLGIEWRDVALLLPPNLNHSFVRLLISKAELRADRVYTRNISRYGYLMASDPVINLKTALAEGAVKNHDIVLTLSLGLAQSIGCVAIEV